MAAAQERLTTTISTKGQVILPKAVRDLRHWPAGTRLAVENTAEGVLLKLAPVFPPSSIDQVFGSLKHKGAALSVEGMETAVAAEAKRRARD
ncbi:AbrB/MazE/SpoVT family DNA-binding domain-containing protein [Sphingosinicella soli]|uniref:AbrB family looped-hinge helix DNA binding protein n=1 Tax=Sphingosinicella soli TaxID=333708 RepID=A0A7W7B3C9_9SPHN|nr:AbrB family looped-hinge helix DNA binding protein [Sphingosinicella soli]